MLIQPFVNYNLGDGWALASSPIITADWENTHGHEWTVPMSVNTSLQGDKRRRAGAAGRRSG